jgi:SAM-dependent methyltransferase
VSERPAPRQGFFDLWSRVYDAPLVQWATYRPVQDAVVRILRRASSGPILDVGCGTGLLTARLRDELAPPAIVGVDFSRGMLHEAARRSAAVSWVRGTALALPFRDALFGAVVSTEAFHWFPDQEAALAEFHRVLAPGGRLIVAFSNPRTEWLSRVLTLGSRLAGEPAHWPTRRWLRGRAEAVGFRVDAQRTVLRLPVLPAIPCVLTVATRPEAPAGRHPPVRASSIP